MAAARATARRAASAAPTHPGGESGKHRVGIRPALDWLEIDAYGFAANIRTLQSKLSPNTALCAVMKADTYGHGVELLAPTLVRSGVK